MTNRDRAPRALFLAGCLSFAFLYGFSASHFGWFPSSFMTTALEQLTGEGGPDADDPDHHMYPARHEFEGALSYPRDRCGPACEPPGLTLLTSYWPDRDWRPGLRLIDAEGRLLHSWHVDPPAIWPVTPHTDPVGSALNKPRNYVHGSYLFENGDVLFNVEYMGLVRMDARGKVLWTVDRRTHHSVHRDDDGNFWVSANRWMSDEEAQQRFPGLIPPFTEDYAILVSPEGKVLREVSILDVVFRSIYKSLLWTSIHTPPDITHANDIEPLPAAMAKDYPMFAPGDLLISVRNLHLVCVFCQKTGVLKWALPGVCTVQHDADFIGGGWISIYDNNADETVDGSQRGGSRLIAVQAHTGATRQIYPNPEPGPRQERSFYSRQGGKAQLLANGHWLITESTAGRVFEIDERGQTVWEWAHKRHDDGRISEVLEGTRYSHDARFVQAWAR